MGVCGHLECGCVRGDVGGLRQAQAELAQWALAELASAGLGQPEDVVGAVIGVEALPDRPEVGFQPIGVDIGPAVRSEVPVRQELPLR